jgi:hypothetical protein
MFDMDSRVLRAIQALAEAQGAIDDLTRALACLRDDADLAERVASAGLEMPHETLMMMSDQIDDMIGALEQLD